MVNGLLSKNANEDGGNGENNVCSLVFVGQFLHDLPLFVLQIFKNSCRIFPPVYIDRMRDSHYYSHGAA